MLHVRCFRQPYLEDERGCRGQACKHRGLALAFEDKSVIKDECHGLWLLTGWQRMGSAAINAGCGLCMEAQTVEKGITPHEIIWQSRHSRTHDASFVLWGAAIV